MVILTILTIFDNCETGFEKFLICLEMVLCRELMFFALHSVHQNPSFDLSKSSFRQIFQFVTLRGDPNDFGVVKSYMEWKKWTNKIPPKKSERLDQMEEENAFGGTLLSSESNIRLRPIKCSNAL